MIATALAKDPREPLPDGRGPRPRRARAPSTARRWPAGVRKLAAGESPSGWSWPAIAAAVARRSPAAAGRARRASSRAAPFVGRADALERLRRALPSARSPAPARSSCSPASRGSASRGWPPSSPARPTTTARPSSTAAATPSRSSPTSRSSPPSSTSWRTASTLELPPELAPGAERAGPPGPRAAPPPARAARAARRGRRDAPLPPVRGRHPRARPRSPRRRPTVLILDDLQWADTSTALLLGHILQDIEATQAARASGRSASPAATAPRRLTDLISRLYRDPGFERIALEGPGRDRDRARWCTPPPRARPAARSSSSSRTAPRATRSSSRRRCAAWSRWSATSSELEDETLARVPVPEGIRELIHTRLVAPGRHRVAGADARRGGRPRVPAGGARGAARRAGRAHHLRAGGGRRRGAGARGRRRRRPLRVRPRAGPRDACTSPSRASRRVRMHHRIAQALEDLGPLATPAELAHHFVESRHLDREGKAVDYCEQAAIQAADAARLRGGQGALRGRAGAPAQQRAAPLRAADRPRHRRRAHERPRRRSRVHGGRGDRRARGAARAARPRRDRPRRHATRTPAASTTRRSRCSSPRSRRRADEGPLVALLLARLANALHFAGDSDRVRRAQRAGARARATAAAIRSRWSPRWRAATARCCTARDAGRAAADRHRALRPRRAHRRARAEDARPALAHLGPARAGRRRRRPPRVAPDRRARRRAAPAGLPLPRRALGGRSGR